MTNKELLKDIIITLGVCGASTAYKSVNLVERMRQLGGKVRVVLNDEAKKYVTPLTFEQVSGEDVVVEASGSSTNQVVQSSLITESDVTVIAPASFSFIGKLASGLGTDPLTELVSGSTGPVLLAPAMNRDLYSSKTLRSYLDQIKEPNFHILEPTTWQLEDTPDQEVPLTIVISRIISKVRDVLKEDRILENKRILVTSGPTRDLFSQPSFTGGETNISLGYSLSQQARQMGGEVTLVSGPTEQITPTGIGVVWIRTAGELEKLLISELPKYDIILMVDGAEAWSPDPHVDPLANEKTKKFDMEIKEVPDLARKLGRLKEDDKVLVEFIRGFEDDDLAQRRLEENYIDAAFVRANENQKSEKQEIGGSLLFKPGSTEQIKSRNSSRLSRKLLKSLAHRYFN